MLNGKYIGSNPRLKDKTALLQVRHDKRVAAQFDDTTLPEAFGWWMFEEKEFQVDDT